MLRATSHNTGRVDVKIKQAVNLRVRVPDWASPQQTRSRLNGADRRVDWDGRYCKVGWVAPGDTVSLTFPIGERTDVVHIEKDRFTLVRRGNDVVSIDPPGRIHRCISASTIETASPGGAACQGSCPTKSSTGRGTHHPRKDGLLAPL